MVSKLKLLACLFGFSLLGWIGWNRYNYFFDASGTTLALVGIENGMYYSGEVDCKLNGQHSFKVYAVSVFLDDHQLIKNFRIGSREFEHSIPVDTRTLEDGRHILKVEAIAGTSQGTKTFLEREFFVDNQPIQAAFVNVNGESCVNQGKTLHIKFRVNKPVDSAIVSALSQEFVAVPESKNSLIYESFVPVACEEEPKDDVLKISIKEKTGGVCSLESNLKVVQSQFKRQQINVSAQKMDEEAKVAADNERLESLLAEALKNSPKEKLWSGSFCTPLEIKNVYTDFGTIRTTQLKGRYSHKGLDVADMPKSAVWATQHGKVIVKDRFVFSGNTVVLDHGCGVFSLFFHLEDMNNKIEVGQLVKQGTPLGTTGMTGYATGYHLHWEMRVNNISVDPRQWVDTKF
ncbi:MAG: Peptidase M23B [candidate division TM6 bacterium GW2011_GWF2_32_72]|nr:MAG: Peptidase M23B [candidate division TM6 bacterium GW2011_GWF2_32_72]